MSEQLGIPSVPVIDRVIELQPARLLDIEGFTHIDKDKSVTLFKPPAPEPITVHTLSGFVGLLSTGFEGYDPAKVVVHVEEFDEVHLLSNASDKFGRRQVYVKAKALKPERQFPFNQYMAQESFLIGLRSMFVQGPAVDDLLKVAGNLAAKAELRQEDDGFTQTATMKAGVVRVEEKTINPRVTLQPFRTFLEVDQPSGDFIFRIKAGDAGSQCALFEADAGRWKLDAMTTIQAWLRNQLRGSDDVAIGGITVVA